MIGDGEGDIGSGTKEGMAENGDEGQGGIPDLGAPVGNGSLREKPLSSDKGEAMVEEGSRRVIYSDVLVEGISSQGPTPDFVVKDGVAEVAIPEEVFTDVVPLWKCFMVGYFMNDAPHIGSIHATVNRIWNSPGKKVKIDVQFIGKSTVLFRIEDAAIRNRILNRKFWHISDVPLMLGEWTPETARSPPDLSAMPMWVELLNVLDICTREKALSSLPEILVSSSSFIPTLSVA
ncbi:DUF4283 domain-containing protein [Raphanus sativus]|nr:DUF4283 domain-containing protein [Raphanus sativus]